MSPDDALLIAYADGELDDAARADLEAALVADEGLRQRLAAIRTLQAALASLPAPADRIGPERRVLLMARAQRQARTAIAARWRPAWALAAGVALVLGALALVPNLSGSRVTADYEDIEIPPVRVMTIPPPPAVAKEIVGDGPTFDTPVVNGLMEANGEVIVSGEATTGHAPGQLREAPVKSERMLDVAGSLTWKRDAGGAVSEWRADKDGRGLPPSSLRKPAAPPTFVGQMSPISQLDLPSDDAVEESDGQAKGREEAVADSEMGGQGAFMAIGAGGGSSGAFGQRSGGGRKRAVAQHNTGTSDEKAPLQLRAGEADARAAQRTWSLSAYPAQAPAMLAQQFANRAPAGLLAPTAQARVGNLVEQYRLPVALAPEASARLAQLGGLPVGDGLSAGEQLVFVANRAGLQALPAGGRLELAPPQAILDPTDRLGMDGAGFTAAFGTPPMSIIAEDAQQTFALDGDAASFAQAQAELAQGRLPDPAAVRPEHFVNAVPAGYAPPRDEAFALYAEAGPSPFARGRLAARTALVAVGVVGRVPEAGERRPLRLVVALDGSGSMAAPGAMTRARLALDGLAERLGPDDRIAVVAFAGRGRVVQTAIPGGDPARLRAAFDAVRPGGSTNTAEGVALAVQMARELAAPGAELRVLLATDGAAIAGPEAAAAGERLAALAAAGGSLTLLTVGEAPPDPRALEELVRRGDGQHLHLGDDGAARSAVEGSLLPQRLATLARDAKAQVTWNPERVTHARLVGYERRRLAHRDFRNDAVDAGEIAAATTVTALFEVVLAEGGTGPLGTAAVRYLDTRRQAVRELACPMPGSILASQPSPRLRLLASSAELAEQLRGSWWANARPTSFRAIAAVANGLPEPGPAIARMAEQAERLRPLPEIRP